jgi:hypothetical protein
MQDAYTSKPWYVFLLLSVLLNDYLELAVATMMMTNGRPVAHYADADSKAL